jgi:hypothetical protein
MVSAARITMRRLSPSPYSGIKQGSGSMSPGKVRANQRRSATDSRKRADVEALQIAQAAVHDAQRIAARSTAKVRALEQQDPQAALGRLQCDAYSMNSAADHGEIEPLRGCGEPARA